jgi:hypothetical protein
MFTAVGVEQGSIITEGLNAWYDFGDIACFNPTLYTGSIAASTPFFNLAPNQASVSGSITGAVNWSTAFGGCLNLTNANTSTLQYSAGFSASFTVQTIITPGTDASPSANWSADKGGWPTLRATNGIIWAQQYSASPGNFLIPILYAGASSSTLPTSVRAPKDGWNEYMRFPNVYTFSTNGTNLHNTYMNNVNKSTDTTTRTRGNSAVGTIYLNFDPAVGDRHGTGRIAAYLHYNRQLSDEEIYQNAQYYLNRFGTK